MPGIETLCSHLSDTASRRQTYDESENIIARLQDRTGLAERPLYAGLVNQNTRNGVLLFSARNAVQGEWVSVEFAPPKPNRRIFRADDEIIDSVIDGALPDAKIFTALLEMLQDLRAEVRRRGMIPTLPGGKFGEITHAELFPVLHRIQSVRGPAQVRVLAVQETWTSDQLEIRFEVEEGTSE